MYSEFVDFVKNIYKIKEGNIPLHAPVFFENENKYLKECIDTTFVSYVGKFVSEFENVIKAYTGAKYAVAIVNGTCALHIALKLNGASQNDEVLTQSLTFIATSNSISYCDSTPVYIDSDINTLGMSVEKLEEFLEKNTEIRNDGFCYNNITKKRIIACVPVHIFGHPCKIDRIVELCSKYNIAVVEDAAESLGSKYKGKHTGTFGKAGILSFNGNKIVTTGGGGMIITDDENFAVRAKHITTTAKVPHQWEFIHDEIGYNYRMTNLNAAVGCAQMENIDFFLENKRQLAGLYKDFFYNSGIDFFVEKADCYSNYWLNAILLKNRNERDEFLKFSNQNSIMTRPAWTLMNKLKMYENCLTTNLENANWLEDRIVNIPSSVRVQ
ncbi:MAG: LegC family aminotransferase [Bacteroidota bacterium]|nr:LegC family aminotransferase [Bacteroidota bacterium]